MSDQNAPFYQFLSPQDDAAWTRIIAELTPSIHPVDQRAVRIWFAFFPVKLHRALAESLDPADTAKRLLIRGRHRLADQVDSSADFLYGHSYWPEVKQAVSAYAATTDSGAPLAEQIREVAHRVAGQVKVDESLIVGITAVAFGTLQQVGAELFKQPAAAVKRWQKSPDQIVADREKDDSQGLFGFLKSVDKKFSVNFREIEPGCSFKVFHSQDVTTAAALDKREHELTKDRSMLGEGVIPVECRTAACGTCWVGVLSPTEKISPPTDREINRWVYFGYEGFTGEADSPIRLACQLKAYGNVTLVIPPWNGLLGKLNEKEKTATA